jgi:hypothetical protein
MIQITWIFVYLFFFRYRLGYLFNKLRRYLNVMRKMVTAARHQYADKRHENLMGTMSLYEAVVRIDVDIRDTIEIVKKVYAERYSYDNVF